MAICHEVELNDVEVVDVVAGESERVFKSWIELSSSTVEVESRHQRSRGVLFINHDSALVSVKDNADLGCCITLIEVIF